MADIKFSVERVGEDTTLKCDFSQTSVMPSVEDSSFTMSKVIEKVAEISGISKIVFYQKREYEYDYQQTSLLTEIAILYRKLSREKDQFGVTVLSSGKCKKFADSWYTQIKNIISNLLLKDPLGAFVELKRIKRREKIILEKSEKLFSKILFFPCFKLFSIYSTSLYRGSLMSISGILIL